MPDWTYDTQLELTDAGRTAVYFPEPPELETEDEPETCPTCGSVEPSFCAC